MTQYRDWFKPTQRLAVNACGELKVALAGWSMGSCCPAPFPATSVLRPLRGAGGQATCLTGAADGKIPPVLPIEIVTWG